MRPRVASLALLVAFPAALAGCVGNGGILGAGGPVPDAAALACIATICEFESTVDPDERQGNEVSVAVNPTDPRNIIATAKDYNPTDAGECVYAGIYVTKDGGATWKNANVPGSPWRRLQDPTTPLTAFSRFWCVTDPVVAFGPDGTAYWTVMPYQCDRFSGSKTGRGVLPNGGFNDWFWTCSAMYVLVSEDGGETWPTAREVDFGPQLEHDKQWIAAAPDGKTVLLCWDRGDPSVWNTGTPLDEQTRALEYRNRVACARSGDKGSTWTDPVDLPDDYGSTPWIDYEAEGRAWMVTTHAASPTERLIQVTSSADGLAWDAPAKVANYTMPATGGEYGWPVLRGSDFRIVQAPSIAVDRSSGPDRGSVYVTWFDHAAGEGDVWLAASRDGKTWEAPIRVHDDDLARKADQFMPAVSVGPDGTVDVSWHDRRDDPANHLFDLYYAYSLNGGRTFSKNLRVTAESSDEKWSHHQNGMVFLGDYRDSDSVRGAVTLVWVDTRNEKADVFVATVSRPSADGG